MMSSPSSVIVVFLLSISLLEMPSDVDASLLKKVFKKFIFSGLPLPLIVGLTTHHPVESYYRVAHPKSFDGGLHGWFARYGPYDSQEWWPEADD